MTARQEAMMNKVRTLIVSTRVVLDDIMYRSDPLDDAEFSRIRETYDLICEANDKL